MEKRLYRSRENQVIAGVCGGIAEYFNVDPVLIRLLAAIMLFVGGTGVMAYIICWVVIPERPKGVPVNSGGRTRKYEDETNDASRFDNDYFEEERYSREERYDDDRYEDDRYERTRDKEFIYDDEEDQYQRKVDNKVVLGAGLMLIGGWLLLEKLLPFSLGYFFWPAVLILAGVFILFRGKGDA